MYTITASARLCCDQYRHIHREKSFSIFPSPAGMSLAKLSLGGNNDVIYKLFLPWEILVSDITAEDGNNEKFFSRWTMDMSEKDAPHIAQIVCTIGLCQNNY
jgi:hypothetical protein